MAGHVTQPRDPVRHESVRVSARISILLLGLLPSVGAAADTPQSIWFSPLSTSTHVLTALASSGLPVSFTSTTPEICEAVHVSMGQFPSFSYWAFSIVGLGTCSITTNQGGDSTYAAASPVTQALLIPAPLPQTIKFAAFADMILGVGAGIAGPDASATSGLGVTFTSLTPSVCTTFIYEDGSAGIMAPSVRAQTTGVCTIEASQSGNAAWTPASSVTQSFTINAPAGSLQTISFLRPPDVTFGQTSAVPLSATASSGLPVSFASNTPAVCSVSGASAVIAGVGACNITASQPGNATYLAAAPSSVSFNVNPAHPADVAINYLVSAAGSGYSPGSLFSIFGSSMASGTIAATPPLPLSSNGTVVTFNGSACPLLYVSPAQINAQVPADAALGLATVAVSFNGTSASATMQVLPASPGFFMTNAPGGYLAIAQHGDYSSVTAANPARPGEIVTFYGTGIGPVSPAVSSGQPAPGSPNLAVSIAPYSATIDGIDAPVSFLGLTPGLAGVMQLNLQIPAQIPSGFLTMDLTINGVTSAVTVPVAGQ
jgi:uncharacterized protein (TIGR03437 family)